jgi:hypothetical protein
MSKIGKLTFPLTADTTKLIAGFERATKALERLASQERPTGGCGTCRWGWNKQCRRHPPQMFGDVGNSMFPYTAESCWCGDYEPLPEDDQDAPVPS